MVFALGGYRRHSSLVRVLGITDYLIFSLKWDICVIPSKANLGNHGNIVGQNDSLQEPEEALGNAVF